MRTDRGNGWHTRWSSDGSREIAEQTFHSRPPIVPPFFSSLATIRPCFTNSRARNTIRCQGCRWTPLREFSWQSSCCFVGSLMSIIREIFHWEGFFMSHLVCIYGIISRIPWRIIPLLKLILCFLSLPFSLSFPFTTQSQCCNYEDKSSRRRWVGCLGIRDVTKFQG